jgi:hypothetical protein
VAELVLTRAAVQELVRVYLGFELDDALAERLLPRVARMLEVSRELQELDLGDMDPRAFHYLNDRRFTP